MEWRRDRAEEAYLEAGLGLGQRPDSGGKLLGAELQGRDVLLWKGTMCGELNQGLAKDTSLALRAHLEARAWTMDSDHKLGAVLKMPACKRRRQVGFPR